MRTIALLISALVGLSAMAVHAQGAPAPQQLASPADGYADCAARVRRTLHDHGIERGYGPMPIKACLRTTLANASASPAVTADTPPARRDHGRFHKNQ